MKKKIGVALFIVAAFIIGGCSSSPVLDEVKDEQTINDDIQVGNKELQEEKLPDLPEQSPENWTNTYNYDLTLIDWEIGSSSGPWCYHKNNLIYFEYGTEGNEDTALFYQYDLSEKEIHFLGETKNPYLDLGDVTANENKLYFYRSSVTDESDLSSRAITQTLYEIDIEDNTIIPLATDEVYSSLIYVDMLGNDVISLKGKGVKGNGKYLLDIYDSSQSNAFSFCEIVTKIYSQGNEKNESVYGVSVDGDIIYALIKVEQKEMVNWVIEQYDISGKYLGCIEIVEQDIIDFLNTYVIKNFEVMGDYIFISNLSNYGRLLKNTQNGLRIILKNDEYSLLHMAMPIDTADHSYAVFYDSLGNDAWELDVEAEKLSEIEFPVKIIKQVLVDEPGNIMVCSGDYEYYVNE